MDSEVSNRSHCDAPNEKESTMIPGIQNFRQTSYERLNDATQETFRPQSRDIYLRSGECLRIGEAAIRYLMLRRYQYMNQAGSVSCMIGSTGFTITSGIALASAIVCPLSLIGVGAGWVSMAGSVAGSAYFQEKASGHRENKREIKRHLTSCLGERVFARLKGLRYNQRGLESLLGIFRQEGLPVYDIRNHLSEHFRRETHSTTHSRCNLLI